MSDTFLNQEYNGTHFALLESRVENLAAEVKTLKEAYFGNGKPGLKTSVERVLELAQVINQDQKEMKRKLDRLETTVEHDQTKQETEDRLELKASRSRKMGFDRVLVIAAVIGLVISAIMMVVAIGALWIDLTKVKTGEIEFPKISDSQKVNAAVLSNQQWAVDPTIR